MSEWRQVRSKSAGGQHHCIAVSIAGQVLYGFINPDCLQKKYLVNRNHEVK